MDRRRSFVWSVEFSEIAVRASAGNPAKYSDRKFAIAQLVSFIEIRSTLRGPQLLWAFLGCSCGQRRKTKETWQWNVVGAVTPRPRFRWSSPGEAA